ncbi:MAG TPA: hypothetical protein VHE54_08870 [Puia sp.]|nr:hypothetical protein [Puia sp.]
MYLPMISGYELGQFLRILLWIFVPVAILSMLVTTWLHYRRRRRESGEVFLSIEGFDAGGSREEIFIPARLSENEADRGKETEEDGDQEYKNTVYKGILWMKEKYEQYRDLSDQRYERLKEDLAKAEKKYQDLLASIVEVKVGDRREKLLSATAHALVEGRADALVEGRTDALVEGRADVVAIAGEAIAGRAKGSTGAAQDEGGGQAVIQASRPVPVSMTSAAEVERDSLRDLLAERNQQIVFLQRQLDQRIKDFHMAEYEGRGAREQIMELEEQSARTRQRLEEEVDRIRHQLEEEIARRRRQLEEQMAESKRQLEEQEANTERRLEEKQRTIAELEEQLHVCRQKVEELVDKLRNNSQLLLNIYQELDKSLRTTDTTPQP